MIEEKISQGAKAAKKATAPEMERQKEQQKLERGSILYEQRSKPRDHQGVPLRAEKHRNNQTKTAQEEWIVHRKLYEESLLLSLEKGMGLILQ